MSCLKASTFVVSLSYFAEKNVPVKLDMAIVLEIQYGVG